MSVDPREELRQLAAAFRAHLAWLGEHGARGVPALPSPRFGVAQRAGGSGEAARTEGARACLRFERSDQGQPAEPALAAPLAAERLEQIRAELGACQRCGLAEQRTNIVFGSGSPEAEIMFIGEGPGHDEDLQGEPFVGAAGQLLTKMIEAMGLRREEVYIANIVKCRPPQNRDPLPDEVDACEPFLRKQIAAIGPRIIIAMGNAAARTLLRTDVGITRLRGRFHTYQGVPLMPTFHPAYLLRNTGEKRAAWTDLKAVMAEMDRLGLRRRR